MDYKNDFLEEIRLKKRLLGYTNAIMAEKSGLPLSTVQKVLGGTTKSPRFETLLALESAFPKEENAYAAPSTGALLEEALPAPALPEPVHYPYTCAPPGKYPRQGSYTLEDYLALPDDQRVELIDGVFYDMGAPTIPHQVLGGEIFALLRDFLRKKKGPCMPLVSPVDVQLDRDDKTILQPDVMVVCDRSKLTPARVFGAPDFLVEVLSPGTRSKDMLIKYNKYRNAGVKEYWAVDPKKETVIQYLFDDPCEEEPDGDITLRLYSFDQPVPVELFQGELEINFREIADSYAFFKEQESCPGN